MIKELLMNLYINRLIQLTGVALALLVASCAMPNASETSTSTPAESPVVETSSPTNSNTNDVAMTTEDVQTVTVVEGLEHPWSMAWLPNGDQLITERPGRLRIVRNGTLDPTPIAGVPEVFAFKQGGLLDISIHPRFAENRLIYFTYSHGNADANRTRVARATFDGEALQNVEVIFEVSQTKPDGQHFGSRITWLPDNTMLVAIGDGGNPPVQLEGDLIREQAQNLNSHLGKIVRLNDDGSVPQDNPFVNRENADPAIWSYGHRNIQGLTLDPDTGRIWSTEHGSLGGDELNLLKAGENYGWPVVTHSREYSGGEISSERSRPGMIDPRAVWTPAKAPSGLAVYTGDRFPGWRGNLFAGGLVSRDVRRIQLDESGNVVNQEPIEIGERVRDVRQSPDGFLYILTDQSDGKLIRIEPVSG